MMPRKKSDVSDSAMKGLFGFQWRIGIEVKYLVLN